MLPTYSSGDLLLGKKWGRPHDGSVIVAQFGQPLVKRVIRTEPDGRLWLQGDNFQASTDSRQFGAIDPKLIEATILAKLG
jgi:phage repressor protein C with HTH and peptisase S24 domain